MLLCTGVNPNDWYNPAAQTIIEKQDKLRLKYYKMRCNKVYLKSKLQDTIPLAWKSSCLASADESLTITTVRNLLGLSRGMTHSLGGGSRNPVSKPNPSRVSHQEDVQFDWIVYPVGHWSTQSFDAPCQASCCLNCSLLEWNQHLSELQANIMPCQNGVSCCLCVSLTVLTLILSPAWRIPKVSSSETCETESS